MMCRLFIIDFLFFFFRGAVWLLGPEMGWGLGLGAWAAVLSQVTVQWVLAESKCSNHARPVERAPGFDRSGKTARIV